MVDDASRNELQADLDPTLAHVHLALVPDLNGIGKMADLQSRIWRNLPPEAASRIAWVHPDAFCVVLGYLGRVRRSLVPGVQDLCRRLLPGEPPNLQAQRIVTSHDAQGTPRVLGIGFAVDSYLMELQSRLRAELESFGVDMLPREFTPRLTLARLPEDLIPVMAVLENFASSFPVTIRFPEVDLAARGERNQKLPLDRVVLSRARHEGLFDRLHGCCLSQANRFAFPQMMDCPLKNSHAFDLPCFETGQCPTHPVEEPGTNDGQVDAGMIHEGTQDLLRIGRNRPLGRAALLDAARDDEHREAEPAASGPPPAGRPQSPRDNAPRDNRPPRDNAPRDNRPPRDNAPRDNRPPRDNAPRDNRPPRDNAPRDNRPPRDNAPRDNRPPRDNAPRDNAPRDNTRPSSRPQSSRKSPGLQTSHRDPRAPQSEQPREPRQPRDNRPPREKSDAPREKSDAPREKSESQRDGQRRSSRRSGDGPRPQQDRNPENRPPSEQKQPPETGEQ